MSQRKPPSPEWTLARPALVPYWLFTFGGLGALAFAVLAYERHRSSNDYGVLAVMTLGTVLGTFLGAFLALRRVRPVVLILSLVATVILAMLLERALRAPLFWVFLFSAGFSLVCGHLAPQHRFELVASFVPVVGWGGAIMVILNNMRRASVWEESKVSAWLPVPLVLLALGSVGFVYFLGGNQGHRLAVWRSLGGSLRPEARASGGAGRRLRAPWLTFGVIGLFAFVATALISPYLWRTGRGDRPADDGARSRERDKPGTDPTEVADKLDWDRIAKALEQVYREVERKAPYAIPIIPLLPMNRPLRRLWLLRHWRRPLWRVSPTDRVDGLWRYVRAACADAGVEARPREAIEELVERAAPGLPPAEAAELRELGARYRRVRYGLGIPPGEPEALGPLADRAFARLRRRMSRWDRVRCWFRRME
jgi:hypothetical protein